MRQAIALAGGLTAAARNYYLTITRTVDRKVVTLYATWNTKSMPADQLTVANR